MYTFFFICLNHGLLRGTFYSFKTSRKAWELELNVYANLEQNCNTKGNGE